MSQDARRLIVMRHAKSAWDQPELEDHDRPLNRRGRLASTLIGAWLRDLELTPDLTLISTSRRTCETWARMRPLLGGAPEARFLPELYHAEPPQLLRAVRSAPDSARTVMVIAHNPGIEPFADSLRGGSVGRPSAMRFPTAATAVFELTHSASEGWAAARPGGFELTAFEQPKSLV